MRLSSTLLAASLLSLPVSARADEPANADPFRPVQPAWPEGWSGSQSSSAPASSPTPSEPAAEPSPTPEPTRVEAENEVFTFDNEPPETPPAAAAPSAREKPAPEPSGKAVEPPQNAPPKEPPRDVDLHTPHVWMATGGIVLGVSTLAALAIGIALDDPRLAGATLGLGGALGVGGLTVGVVMQNQRLEAAGHDVTPALPTGITLNVALTR